MVHHAIPDDRLAEAGFSVVLLHPFVKLFQLMPPLVLGSGVFAVEDMDSVLICLSTAWAVAVILPSSSQLLPTNPTVARGMLGEPPLDT